MKSASGGVGSSDVCKLTLGSLVCGFGITYAAFWRAHVARGTIGEVQALGMVCQPRAGISGISIPASRR